MLVEHRTYTLKPLRTGDFVKLYEALALPLQLRYLGRLIGFFTTEVGTLNQVLHLWGFDSLADRERRRAEMVADPAWAVYIDALRELDVVVHQETQFLKSVPFSPV
jgi:hypothetical protein